ncbi:MAG: hypothetical protein ACT4N2_01655 [Hyphomicrobium sp.]
MSRSCWVTIRRGGLYLDADAFERFFAGLDAVVLMRSEDALLVLPVRHAAGGGMIVKRRNRAGDRVVDAVEFFRANGIDDVEELGLGAHWSEEAAALVVEGIFACKQTLHNDKSLDIKPSKA